MALSTAMESIFANAQQNAASLISTATLAINAKVNTIEEAENMIQELSAEAVKYNELLTTIMNAMRQVESGDMTKEEAAGIIAPAVKELKDKCTALKIANADAPGDDITEDEIAILRELIIGAKAAAEDRLVAIRLGDDAREDPDVVAEIDAAEEAYLEYLNLHNNKCDNILYNLITESLIESEDNNMEYTYSEYMFACESYMDELEESLYYDEIATEGVVDTVKGGASAIASKLRSGFTKLRRAVRKGDKKAADEANAEIAEATKDFDAAVAEADTPEEKKKLSKAAKIGLAAAATAATAATLYAVGTRLDKMSADGANLNIVGKALAKSAHTVKDATGKVKTGIKTHITSPIADKQAAKQAARDKKKDEKLYNKLLAQKGVGPKTASKELAAVQQKRDNRRNAVNQFKHHPVATVKQGASNLADKSLNFVFTKRGNESYGLSDVVENMSEFDLYDIITECMEFALEELGYGSDEMDLVDTLDSYIDEYDY